MSVAPILLIGRLSDLALTRLDGAVGRSTLRGFLWSCCRPSSKTTNGRIWRSSAVYFGLNRARFARSLSAGESAVHSIAIKCTGVTPIEIAYTGGHPGWAVFMVR